MNPAVDKCKICFIDRKSYLLVSLYDMLKEYSFLFADCVHRLWDWEKGMKHNQEILPNSSFIGPDGVESITRAIVPIESEARELGLDAVYFQVQRIREKLSAETSFGEARQMVENLSSRLIDQLQSRLFLFVSPNGAEIYQKSQLFGPEVDYAFPSAASHIKEAGTCLALECSTAAVFHLMCVLEVGLHALASEFGLPFSKDNWQRILDEIESKVNRMGPERGPEWKQEKEYYIGAALQFRFFKDAWRNHIMHGRDFFPPREAREVFDHVRSFMQDLAKKIEEPNHEVS
jgi:hypothetical protein